MTPILLSNPDTKIAFLTDATKCEVTEERNGIYELELEYPVAGQHFSDIAANCYVKAKPSGTADPQFFRIYSISKPILGTVTVNAEHISYALSHYPIRELPKAKTTALTAINRVLSAANQFLKANHKFTTNYCDISSSSSFGISNVSARAALGGVDSSILDRYGGEYEFDNYTVKLHKSRGKDNGIVIKYGKNMTDMKLTVSTEASYTGIFPYMFGDNDEYITLPEGAIYVDNSSGIEERILSMDFSSYFSDEEEKSEENLRKHANEYLEANDINSIDASMTVSMIDLAQSAHTEYSSYLESVSLCDTIKVIHTLMGVSIKLKVIKTVYDSIAERYISLELGSVRSDFSDVIKQIQKDTNKALKKASEIPDTSALEERFQAELGEMTKAITGASGGHVVLNPSKNPQELLILCDSDNIATAQKLYRWNSAGLAYSSDGYNGTYSAGFLGADGKLIINNVTARSISADLIKAGTITSENGELLINLNEGQIISGSSTYNMARYNAGNIDFYYGGKFSGRIGQTSDNHITIEGLYPESTTESKQTDLYIVNGGLIASKNVTANTASLKADIKTGQDGTDNFASIEHCRQHQYATSAYPFPAFSKCGIGGRDGSPTLAYELRIGGRDKTSDVRLDIYQRMFNTKHSGSSASNPGTLSWNSNNDVDVCVTANGRYSHTLRFQNLNGKKTVDFITDAIATDDLYFVSSRDTDGSASSWSSLLTTLSTINSNVASLDNGLVALRNRVANLEAKI